MRLTDSLLLAVWDLQRPPELRLGRARNTLQEGGVSLNTVHHLHLHRVWIWQRHRKTLRTFAFTALHTVWCSQGNDGNDSFPFVVMFVWMWDSTGDKRLYRKKHFFLHRTVKWKISLTVKKMSFLLFLTTKQRKPQLCDTSTRGRHMLVFRTPW